VLKRGVELLELQRLVAFCRARGLRLVVGRYLPTVKNKLVSGHYAQLGFRDAGVEDGGTTWHLDLTTPLATLPHYIAVTITPPDEENDVALPRGAAGDLSRSVQ
jgi:predicted enzyme involved in methoxymalonyl-ACP biosynthesis